MKIYGLYGSYTQPTGYYFDQGVVEECVQPNLLILGLSHIIVLGHQFQAKSFLAFRGWWWANRQISEPSGSIKYGPHSEISTCNARKT